MKLLRHVIASEAQPFLGIKCIYFYEIASLCSQ